MKKIQILIVEDEVLVAKDIQSQLQTLGYEVCKIATGADQVFEGLISNPPDLILMDINIDGDLDGIETAAKVKETHSIPIIFLTDIRDVQTFQRAKQTSPAVFLNKPFNEHELSRHIELAIHNTYSSSSEKEDQSIFLKDSLWVKEGFSYKKISISDILWLKASGAYCDVVCSANKLTLSKSMREVNDILANSRFIKVHKSYIVNSEKIEEMRGANLIIEGNKIPIGKTFFQDFKKKLKLL